MTIVEMHELFRVLGQQMGMQKVRAILPESIDILINTSIIHCVRQIITSNVTTNFGNIIATQKNKVSVINALRTLYTEREIDIDGANPSIFYNFDIFSIIDCSVSYSTESPYKYISTRLIEPNLIDEAERDYLLRPTSKFPVATIVGVTENSTQGTETGTLIDYNFYTGNSTPTRIKTSFIKYPVKVHYDEQGNNHVHCDLPIHLHHMIVEEAVKLYLQSVHITSGGSDNSQQTNKN